MLKAEMMAFTFSSGPRTMFILMDDVDIWLSDRRAKVKVSSILFILAII
jgi:hypothetical protein